MNACGGCTACCTTHQIDVLNKPAFRDCQHQRPWGCNVYVHRPDVCRDFTCIWATREDAKEVDRPDRCGVVISATSPDEPVNQALKVIVLVAHEVWPGAFASYHGDRVIKAYSKRVLMQLVPREGERSWVGPERVLAKLRRAGGRGG